MQERPGVSITIAEVLLFLIENGPGRTESELAGAIFGGRAISSASTVIATYS